MVSTVKVPDYQIIRQLESLKCITLIERVTRQSEGQVGPPLSSSESARMLGLGLGKASETISRLPIVMDVVD